MNVQMAKVCHWLEGDEYTYNLYALGEELNALNDITILAPHMKNKVLQGYYNLVNHVFATLSPHVTMLFLKL